jgi:hypothetical protein
MSIGAFQAAREGNCEAIYINTDNQRIIHLGQTIRNQELSQKLRVQDYIELLGGTILSAQTSFFQNEGRLKPFSKFVLRDPKRWDHLHRFFMSSTKNI